MNKQNILTSIKTKSDEYTPNASFDPTYIFNNLHQMSNFEKKNIVRNIISNNFLNKILIKYMFNTLKEKVIQNNNIEHFLFAIFYYLNIYHSLITITQWKINKTNDNYICEGTYDLSNKSDLDFLCIINKIYDILKINLEDKYDILFKMYERQHGHLLKIVYEINKKYLLN